MAVNLMLADDQLGIESKFKNPSILCKTYVWSVLMEPLLLFVVALPIFGLAISISKFLQLMVLLILGLRFLVARNHVFFARIPAVYKKYFHYLIFALCSYCYGIYTEVYISDHYTFSESLPTFVYRPIFEYGIILYYFLYYVMLANYFLKTPRAINYFFKIFKFTFFLTLSIGFLDLALIYMSGAAFEGLPRHLSDMTRPGDRFHGLAGEPRDAFIYLILGLSMLALKDIWLNERKLTKPIFFMIVTAMILTQSFSGLLGLLFSVVLLMMFFLSFTSVSRLIGALSAIVLMVLIIFVGVEMSPRIQLYIEAFYDLYQTLSAGEEVASILSVSMNNISPVWHRVSEVLEFDILGLLVGTGLGSASAVTNNYLGTNEIANPNANIIRLIFETGLIGTWLIIQAFLKPIKTSIPYKKDRSKMLFYMLILLGAFFAHRSVTPFIFLGALLVVFQNKRFFVRERIERSESSSGSPML